MRLACLLLWCVPWLRTLSAAEPAEREAEFQERANWWSLQSPHQVSVPLVADERWSREPVDRFLWSVLRERGLSPAAPAGRDVLLRRLSLVLTGLPPTAAVQSEFRHAWSRDPRGAVESLVDRLLAAPHYGERFARHWMDVVRYTDTYGYESDNPAQGAWEYRDYLIRAFNQDVGFDQLILEQLAGDLLPAPRIQPELQLNESVIGPMFYHLGEHREGGSLMFNGIHQQMIDNKIDAFSKAFLAMTVACARCHDHKLDPVSQRDYYALAAVFMTPRWTSRVIDSPERNRKALVRLRELRETIRQELAALWDPVGGRLESMTVEALRTLVPVDPAREVPPLEIAAPLVRLLRPEVNVTQAWDELAAAWRDTQTQAAQTNARFTVLADFREPGLPAGWVGEGAGLLEGFAVDGTPLISLQGETVIERLLPRGIHTHALSAKLPGAVRSPPQHLIPGQRFSALLAGGEYGGYLVVQGNGFKSEEIGFFKSTDPVWKSFSDAPLKNGVQRVTVEFATTSLNPNFPPRIGLSHGLPHNDPGYDKRSWFSLLALVTHDAEGTPADPRDEFQSLYESPPPTSPDEARQRLTGWLAGAVRRWVANALRPGDDRLLNWLLVTGVLPNRAEDPSPLASALAEYRQVEATIAHSRTVTGMDERDVPRQGYPLDVRGDVDRPGELIAPDFLQVFAGRHRVGDSPASGRRELAEFLVHSEHPLTARVYVNRVWQWIFGTGLVTTPDDFGHLGSPPSNPELLDYLAREFVREGWSTKRLVRRLVLSEAFQQSGHASDAARQLDPDNRLWHHMPTRRLEAEGIRDALLAVSGRLDPQLYGRPIEPPRLLEDTVNKRLHNGPLDGLGRRSIYLQLSIMDPPRFLVGFDLPDLKLPSGRRNVTSGPTQALALLNDPFVQAMSRHWAHRLVREPHATVDDRLRDMFLAAYSREPAAGELERWNAAFQDLRTEGQSEELTDEGAWQRVAQALFNTKEFLYFR